MKSSDNRMLLVCTLNFSLTLSDSLQFFFLIFLLKKNNTSNNIIWLQENVKLRPLFLVTDLC